MRKELNRLAMHGIEPVIVMCLIGAAVGLLLRWRGSRLALTVLGAWVLCGLVWAAASWIFLAVAAPSEAAFKVPDDLPALLKAIAYSGLVALVPAMLVGFVRVGRLPAATPAADPSKRS
jgi:hypothetical protein